MTSAHVLCQIVVSDGGRLNRTKICDFTGFDFQINSSEYERKVSALCRHLTTGDLNAVCLILNISYDDKKEGVAERICSALIDFNVLKAQYPVEDDEEEDSTCDEENVDSYEGELIAENSTPKKPISQLAAPKFAMSFKDIEDSIRPFSADNSYSVETWVTDFEDQMHDRAHKIICPKNTQSENLETAKENLTY